MLPGTPHAIFTCLPKKENNAHFKELTKKLKVTWYLRCVFAGTCCTVAIVTLIRGWKKARVKKNVGVTQIKKRININSLLPQARLLDCARVEDLLRGFLCCRKGSVSISKDRNGKSLEMNSTGCKILLCDYFCLFQLFNNMYFEQVFYSVQL